MKKYPQKEERVRERERERERERVRGKGKERERVSVRGVRERGGAKQPLLWYAVIFTVAR